MKSLAVIIPVKGLELGKSRLAATLLPRDRLALNRALLQHTFTVAAGLADIAAVYVVSKSAAIRTEAQKLGFVACCEAEACDLNGAIEVGAAQARQHGYAEIMVLPVDLPRVSSDRLQDLVAEFRNRQDVLIVTDRTGAGTNVMLWRPVEQAVFRYGTSSAEAHARAAATLGLRVTNRRDAALSFDLDTPGDLRQWLHTDGRAWCTTHGLAIASVIDAGCSAKLVVTNNADARFGHLSS